MHSGAYNLLAVGDSKHDSRIHQYGNKFRIMRSPDSLFRVYILIIQHSNGLEYGNEVRVGIWKEAVWLYRIVCMDRLKNIARGYPGRESNQEQRGRKIMSEVYVL